MYLFKSQLFTADDCGVQYQKQFDVFIGNYTTPTITNWYYWWQDAGNPIVGEG